MPSVNMLQSQVFPLPPGGSHRTGRGQREIVIARNGRPAAKLVPIGSGACRAAYRRRPGKFACPTTSTPAMRKSPNCFWVGEKREPVAGYPCRPQGSSETEPRRFVGAPPEIRRRFSRPGPRSGSVHPTPSERLGTDRYDRHRPAAARRCPSSGSSQDAVPKLADFPANPATGRWPIEAEH